MILGVVDIKIKQIVFKQSFVVVIFRVIYAGAPACKFMKIRLRICACLSRFRYFDIVIRCGEEEEDLATLEKNVTILRCSRECETTSPWKSADDPGHPPPIFPQQNLTVGNIHLFFAQY